MTSASWQANTFLQKVVLYSTFSSGFFSLQASVQIEGSTFPGRLMFLESSLEVNYTGQWAYIPVVRKHGCIGDVSVDYTTMDGAAKSGA